MTATNPPFHVKALYDYPGSHEDDLSFAASQIITVTEEEDADWYNGHYEDDDGSKREGIFPKNFVKHFEPELPPRPSRQLRPKKDAGPAQVKQESDLVEQVEETQDFPVQENPHIHPAAPPEDIDEPETGLMPKEVEPIKSIQPSATSSISVASKSSEAARAPTAHSTEASAPVDKPTLGSFRDRINAFNKPAAPPVAPMKPGGLGSGGSGFVKKPFVAPPPSKTMYIPPPREPPQTVHRREEHLGTLEPPSDGFTAEAQTEGSTAPALVPASTEEDSDQPKATSLKDRIALLQQQQAEQTARHIESAKRKEKPKRPAQQRTHSQDPSMEQGSDLGDADVTGLRSVDGGDSNLKASRDPGKAAASAPFKEASKEIRSDMNDCDRSDLGPTGDSQEVTTAQEQLNAEPDREIPISPSQQPPKDRTTSQISDEASEESSEEAEDDIDPEMRRRMEIRDRMAKMSGGMGMAGMFQPPGGLPSRKRSSMSNDKRQRDTSSNDQESHYEFRQPPIPIMPMPGMTPPRPRQSEAEAGAEAEVEEDAMQQPTSVLQGRGPEEIPDIEDLRDEPVAPSRRSTERTMPSGPRDRPVPPLPPQSQQALPPAPSDRAPPPLPPNATRPPAPQTPHQVLSPSEGSASDDEMSLTNRSGSYVSPTSVKKKAVASGSPPLLPHRPQPPTLAKGADSEDHKSVESEQDVPGSSTVSSPTIPPPPKRAGVAPPIPTYPPAPTPQSRAPPPPPPPPPPVAPSSRVSTGESRQPPHVPRRVSQDQSDVEVTEYEGDYDTDIAADAGHKDALSRHEQASSMDEDSANDDSDQHHAGSPGIRQAPRAVPPLPPSATTPMVERRSTETPRGPPPPVPPAKESGHQRNESYDPFNYMASRAPPSIPTQAPQVLSESTPASEGPRAEESHKHDPLDGTVVPPLDRSSAQHPSSPLATTSAQTIPRQSTDFQRNSTNMRRSMDAPRPSGENGSIAGDIDLSRQTHWWTQPNMPPPALQGRKDIAYEMEDSNTARRGGRQTITRVIYVLYMDYSQTNVSVHFDPREPTEASFEQHHEPPPSRLRQDQLEEASSRFGAVISNMITTKKETVVGDGSPPTLVSEVLKAIPDALLPIGNRAYGAVIYANLANASVQQFDEIRAGDIVSFRNAKFQGHRGAMHAKYSVEVGKPDHVGVVEDWDGTKKKIRAWEQGRESKKVKLESFKLGDMRSGEIKVWRVMPRQWVGWEGQN